MFWIGFSESEILLRKLVKGFIQWHTQKLSISFQECVLLEYSLSRSTRNNWSNKIFQEPCSPAKSSTIFRLRICVQFASDSNQNTFGLKYFSTFAYIINETKALLQFNDTYHLSTVLSSMSITTNGMRQCMKWSRVENRSWIIV